MTPEHSAANIQSWVKIREFIESFPETSWAEWKRFALRFIQYGLDRKFDRHFRAGQSMSTLVFSTLDRHGLRDEPRVTVSLHPPEIVRLTYWPAIPRSMGDSRLEYELAFEEVMPTFHRFLNHLWEMSVPEALPEDMRSPGRPFSAPVLTVPDARA